MAASRKTTDKNRAKAASPTYILSLSLENVRCFGPRQVLDLSDGKSRPRQWTILLGDNGVGKTTLLLMLRLCQPVAYAEDEGTYFISQSYSKLLSHPHPMRHNTRTLTIDYRLASGPLLRDGNKTQIYAKSYQCRIMHFDNAYYGLPEGHSKLNLLRHGGICDRISRGHSTLNLYAYGADRRIANSSIPQNIDIYDLADLSGDIHDLVNAEEWLLRLDDAARKDNARDGFASRNRDLVVNLLQKVLPDLGDQGIRFTPPDAHERVARVEFRTPSGWVGFSELGQGHRMMLAWMTDLASRLFDRYPDSENPLTEPAVVLIDGIDLHLHPRWQRNLIGSVTEQFPNVQFIATAYSPFIVRDAVNANVVLLRREGDHVVIDNNIESGNGGRVDQLLSSPLYGLDSTRSGQPEKRLAKSRRTKRDDEWLSELNKLREDVRVFEADSERRANTDWLLPLREG